MMRRLIPEPAADVACARADRRAPAWEDAPDDRPFVFMNFALTLDGHSTIDGGRARSAAPAIRSARRPAHRADAVMIGAGTMRAENYGRVVRDPRSARCARPGPEPDPLMVIVRRLEVPWDAPIFTEGDGKVVIFTARRTSRQKPPPRSRSCATKARWTSRPHSPLRASEACERSSARAAQRFTASYRGRRWSTSSSYPTRPSSAGGQGPGLVDGLAGGCVRELEVVWLVSSRRRASSSRATDEAIRAG